MVLDIHKWLDETVLPAQPPSPGPPEQANPAPLLAAPKQPETGPKQRRRRKRSTTDSSIIEVRTERRHPSPIGREADTVDSGDDSACSDAHQPPGHSSRSSASSHRYARRPRRKTRPERYEPKSKDAKERGTKRHRHRKDESKRTKRKRRRKTDKLDAGLVQNFHAKNVPQDRLTLKPPEKLGLFNKGRVSEPIKGRGLPDLVFSEMKFLQKQRDQPEAAPQPGLPKQKKRKKTHTHSKQEEISAYFTSVQPPLAEKDVNIQAKEATRKQSLLRDVKPERQASSVADHAIPTIEAPDKASYLGFGSRGPRHTSGSYISWSDSIRAPSATPRHMQPGSIISGGQLEPTHGDKGTAGASGGDGLHSHTPPTFSRRLTNGSGELFHVSSSIPANNRPLRAHSFPQRFYSSDRVGTNELAELRRTTDTVVSPLSMPAAMPSHSGVRGGHEQPPDVPDIPEPWRAMPPPEKPEINPRSSYLEGEESSVDPNTSSTIGRLLRQCQSAFEEQQRQAAESPQRQEPVPGNIRNIPERNTRRFAETSSFGRIRSLPTVRFSGVETIVPQVPDYDGPGIYEEQERRQAYEQQTQEEVEEEEEEFLQDTYAAEQEDEMMDGDDYEYTYEDLGYEDAPQQITPLGQFETPMDESGQQFEAPHSRVEAPRRRGVAARGFWRPNRLY